MIFKINHKRLDWSRKKARYESIYLRDLIQEMALALMAQQEGLEIDGVDYLLKHALQAIAAQEWMLQSVFTVRKGSKNAVTEG